MKLTTQANRLAGTGNLTKSHVVQLTRAAAEDGRINGTERRELQAVRDRFSDRMTPAARQALDNVIGAIPGGEAGLRTVDDDKVKSLVAGDARLAWRRPAGGGGGGSVGGGESGGGGGSVHTRPVSSGGGENGGGSVTPSYTPTYTPSHGGGE